jgi:holo-[acyl-carrier protein] synthase
MIAGTGIDIEEIESIKASMEQSQTFISKVFTVSEIDYCERKIFKYQHYTARFAAKEAMMKALGTGYNSGVSWKQIEVVHDDLGKPEIILYEKARKISDALGIKSIHLSMSHSESYAVAMVVAEQ